MSSTVGFAVIAILYATIGLLAAVGSAAISQKLLPGKSEQFFYGAFLVAIAGFYLAFTAYFDAAPAWSTELWAVASYSVLGIIGTRYAAFLIFGYSLHGAWDALHELNAHAGFSILEPDRLTEIPLAYGIFCAVYDVVISIYFVRRKGFWHA